ncbi:MAG: hypothetical protein K9G48_11515 [Reyranella sp.]|nr:hypothetical protein [Reyranella sp.]
MSSIMSPIVRRRRVTAASPTPQKLAAFLRHLEASGSVSAAAARAGIARNTVYLRRKVDPAFARGWEQAVAMAAEALRDRAIARARDGTERVLWRGGKRVGTIREYDDRLLMFLLRLLRPEVYGRRSTAGGRADSFSDTPAISAVVEKNRPVQAGRRFANFRTDTSRTTGV